MGRISRYVLNQLEGILPKTGGKYTPILSGVTDLKNKIRLEFSVKQDKYYLTLNDLYLAKLDDNVQRHVSGTREALLSAICSEIKSGIRELLEQHEQEIDFTQPLAPELDTQAREAAIEMSERPDFVNLANLRIIREMGSPLYNYQVAKYIIPILQSKNMFVPPELLSAVQNPNNYFNPIKIIEDQNRYYGDGVPEDLDNDVE